MKPWLALFCCLAIDGVSVHKAVAQITTFHSHSGGYLGVGVAEIDDDRSKALNLKVDHGVVVMNVGANTPAARAGLKESDVILEYNGQRVEGVDEFMRMVRETPPHRTVSLRISRGGASHTLTATLAQNTQSAGALPAMPPMPPMPAMPSMAPTPDFPNLVMSETPLPTMSWENRRIGAQLTGLNSQLAAYFGVPGGSLVQWVSKNSPAEKAGLRAGDVVVRIDGEAVSTPQDVVSRMRRNSNESLAFGIMRNHHELTLSVRPSSDRMDFSGADR